jgi:hypothetical protein
MRFRWFIVSVALVINIPAAIAECVEPVAPPCIDIRALFSGQQEFDQCRQAMETFHDASRGYLLCLKTEVGGAVDHFNDAVDRFNQRAHASNESRRSSSTARELMY